MRKLKRGFVAFVTVVLLGVFGAQGISAATVSSFENEYADAAFSFFSQNTKKGKNVMFSPLSVFVATNLMENGSAGATRQEIEGLFGGICTKKTTTKLSNLVSRLSGSKQYSFRAPCSVWYQKANIKGSYKRAIQNAYTTDVFKLGQANDVSRINSWVKKATNGKISEIVSSVPSATRFLLINAAYFKGEWTQPYMSPTKRTFTLSNGNTKKVAMLENVEDAFLSFDGAKGFVKPYKGGEVDFVAILPPKGTSPEAFVKKTAGRTFRKAYLNRVKSNVVVRTRLPKFKYSFSAGLNNTFKSLGVKRAFNAKAADFSKMTDESIFVNNILHQTYISLNEYGTEAAAVTSVSLVTSCAPPLDVRHETVYLDRPFIYEIVDRSTGLPLFIGIVNNPSA